MHKVELTRGFFLAAHEVTVGQFRQFVHAAGYRTDAERDGKGSYGTNVASVTIELDTACTWSTPGFQQADDHPVVHVNWSDAQAFCRWLSDQEGKFYRLPTEAQWEYACRAGTTTAYAYGDDPRQLASLANVGGGPAARPWDGRHFTMPVGSFAANGFGLHDMHGNVWEWCQDVYDPAGYGSERQVDPAGPASGEARVQRGGGWSSAEKRCRCAARVGRDASAYRGGYLGFRVALLPD